jgi:hypothetical protein
MCGSSVLRVRLRHFVGFSREDKKTALSSCLYLPFIVIRNRSFKVFQGLSLNIFEYTAFKCDWVVSVSEIYIMKDRGTEIARWRTFLGNGIQMRFLVTLFGSHDYHRYHEKWHYFIWQLAKLVCLPLYRDCRQHSAANIPICLEPTWYYCTYRYSNPYPGLLQVLMVPWCCGSKFLWQSAHKMARLCAQLTGCLYAPPFRKYSKYSFLLKAESTPRP